MSARIVLKFRWVMLPVLIAAWTGGGAVAGEVVVDRQLRQRLQQSVDELIAQLRADDLKTREQAQRRLRELAGMTVRMICNHRDDEDPEVAARIAALVSSVVVDAQVETLLKGFPPAQQGQARQFARQHRQLVDAMFSARLSDRAAAIRQLGELADKRATPFICIFLDCPIDVLRLAAIRVSPSYESLQVCRQLGNLALDKRFIRYEISSNTVVHKQWVDYTVRQAVVRALGRMKGPYGVATLVEMLGKTSGDTWISNIVMQSLMEIGDVRVLEKLVKMINNKSTVMRFGRGSRTAGDAALQAVLLIAGQKPKDFGMKLLSPRPLGDPSGGIYGFDDEKARQQAHKKFDTWWQKNKHRFRTDKPEPLPKIGLTPQTGELKY